MSFGNPSKQPMTNKERNIYPERLDYVDQVLSFANQKVTEYANSADLHSQATQSQILSLLLAPIKTYMSMFTALALPSFIPLLHNQPYPTRRAVAGEVARSLLRNQTHITSVENLESVLEILKVLIKEGMQQATGYPGGPIQRRAAETDETVEEQGWLARMVHLIHGPDNDTQFKVCTVTLRLANANITRSFFKLPGKLSRTVTSASNTPRLQSSLRPLSSHGATKPASTSKTTGPRNRPLYTNLCTAPYLLYTLASQAPQTSHYDYSLDAARSQTKMVSKKSHTSTSLKPSRYMRRQSAIPEHSFKQYA